MNDKYTINRGKGEFLVYKNGLRVYPWIFDLFGQSYDTVRVWLKIRVYNGFEVKSNIKEVRRLIKKFKTEMKEYGDSL